MLNQFYFSFWILLTTVNGQTKQTEICPCDRNGGQCDINCCCDVECSEADRKVFSECVNYELNPDSKLCVRKSLVVINNTEFYSESLDKDVLCVYYDNSRRSSIYTEADLVDTVDKFKEYEVEYGSNNFSTVPEKEPEIFANFYTVGQPLLILRNDRHLAEFVLPGGGITNFCQYSSAARYLINSKHVCVESTKNLETKCKSAWHMDGLRFFTGFGLLKNLKKSVNQNSVAEISQNITDVLIAAMETRDNIVNILLTENSVEVSETNETGEGEVEKVNVAHSTKPEWIADDFICKNVPEKIEYMLIVARSGDLQAAYVKITTRHVSMDEQFFSRKFEIDFKFQPVHHDNSSGNGDNYVRSGNPGYIVGSPLTAGIHVTSNESKEAILLSTDSSQWLSMVRGDANGICLNGSRYPVLFGINAQSACLLQMNSDQALDDCIELRSQILDSLVGEARDRVAAYANASVDNAKDWVPLLSENIPRGEAASPRIGTCSNMVLGIDFEFLYTQTGSATSPQAKIIGAKMIYRAPQDITYQCIGFQCSGNRSTTYVVSSTSTFLDVSLPPAPAVADIPTIDVKLPYDFFYPFSGRSDNHRCSFHIIVYLGLISLLHWHFT